MLITKGLKLVSHSQKIMDVTDATLGLDIVQNVFDKMTI